MVVRQFQGVARPFRGMVVAHQFVQPSVTGTGGWLNLIVFEDGDEAHESDDEIAAAAAADSSSFAVGRDAVRLRDNAWHPHDGEWTEEADPDADLTPGALMLATEWGPLFRPVIVLARVAGMVFIKCPDTGQLHVVTPEGLAPFSDENIGAPLAAPVVDARAPALATLPPCPVDAWRCNQGSLDDDAHQGPQVLWGPHPRRPRGSHHDELFGWSECMGCRCKVRPSMYPLVCRGAQCPVTRGRMPLSAHNLKAWWCRPCLQHSPDIAHGEREDILTVPPHVDFAGEFRCPPCVATNMAGRQLALCGQRDRSLTELARRSILDGMHGGLEASGYTKYAGVMSRLTEFERQSGCCVLQSAPTDPPRAPTAMCWFLEWLYSKTVGRCGGKAKVGVIDQARAAVSFVAAARGVPNPGGSEQVKRVVRGIKKRIGLAVERVEPFRLALLLRLLLRASSQPPSFEQHRLLVAIVLSIFAFLRGHETIRLRWRHISVRGGRYPVIELRLLWCKQDVFQVGCIVIICCITKAGLDIQGLLEVYRGLYVAKFGAADPDDLVFPAAREGGLRGLWTTGEFLGAMRAALSDLKAQNEPLLRGRDVRDFTLKSCKRGGSCEATDANPDVNACFVHGWMSRRSIENLKKRCIAETYTDIEDASRHLARRYAVTYLMGSLRESLGV